MYQQQHLLLVLNMIESSVVVHWCSALAFRPLRPNFMALALALKTKAFALKTSALEISFKVAQGWYIFVFSEHMLCWIYCEKTPKISGLPSPFLWQNTPPQNKTKELKTKYFIFCILPGRWSTQSGQVPSSVLSARLSRHAALID